MNPMTRSKLHAARLALTAWIDASDVEHIADWAREARCLPYPETRPTWRAEWEAVVEQVSIATDGECWPLVTLAAVLDESMVPELRAATAQLYAIQEAA